MEKGNIPVKERKGMLAPTFYASDNFMEYKGYTGSVDFSEEDNIFFGKVNGIRSLISYEGKDGAELISDFHNAVDSYLELCGQNGIEPEKPYKDIKGGSL